MQTCRQCKKLFRADHVWELLEESAWVRSLAETLELGAWQDRLVFDSGAALTWSQRQGKKLAPGLALVRNPQVTLSWLAADLEAQSDKAISPPTLLRYLATEQKNVTGLQTPCPNCGGDLTEPRPFNLMFDTHTGPIPDDANKAYLRPETAQGMFVNFKHVLDSSRVRVPFGIAQIGKSFRNEITPRNFTFRSREFEQMEIEFFCHPSESRQWYTYWRDRRYRWYTDLGIKSGNLRLRDHAPDELSHYSVGTADVEYAFPFLDEGEYGELEGVAHRGDFDLRSHMEGKLVREGDGLVVERGPDGKPKHRGSGKDLSYFDDQTRERYVPHVIEPSAGADRATLAFLCEAFDEDTAPDEKGQPQERTVLRLHPRLAPVKAAVFPLIKKEGMPERAAEIYRALKRAGVEATYDVAGAIGRRYRRQDEIGTPFCITVDGQTMQDGTVTARDRDSLEQTRLAADEVVALVREGVE
jgi:glycyl-tRNA synthetase